MYILAVIENGKITYLHHQVFNSHREAKKRLDYYHRQKVLALKMYEVDKLKEVK